jgi:hypothetical protein
MTKGHAGCADQTLHLLFVQRALDELISETTVRRDKQVALDDEDRRQADGHALIRMQGALRKVQGGKYGVQVHRRDLRQIDKVAVLREANCSEGVTNIPSAWSNRQKREELTRYRVLAVALPTQRTLRNHYQRHCSKSEKTQLYRYKSAEK